MMIPPVITKETKETNMNEHRLIELKAETIVKTYSKLIVMYLLFRLERSEIDFLFDAISHIKTEEAKIKRDKEALGERLSKALYTPHA